MSKTKVQVHYSEYVKQGIYAIIVIGIALFGIKSCRKFQQKRTVIVELSSCASESAAYEQFYTENASSNLYKSMHQMHLGVQLGLTPPEILQSVMDDEEKMFSTEKKEDLPVRQALIRDALLSNYDNCVKLAIFEDSNNIESLSNGEAPTIKNGPAAGEVATIQSIIPSFILPGVDKLLPNLMISPPKPSDDKSKSTIFNNFEIARAKKLAQSLASAGLIEQDAYSKIVKLYNKVTAAAPEIKVEATPKTKSSTTP
jgi:hypothetical protein